LIQSFQDWGQIDAVFLADGHQASEVARRYEKVQKMGHAEESGVAHG
jgi:hypothetical protein